MHMNVPEEVPFRVTDISNPWARRAVTVGLGLIVLLVVPAVAAFKAYIMHFREVCEDIVEAWKGTPPPD